VNLAASWEATRIADPFAPWRDEIATVCGLSPHQRCLVAGHGAGALRSSLSESEPQLSCLALDSGGGGDSGALLEWFRSPGTLPRSHCVVRCFLQNEALLREALTPSAGALLVPGGRIVALDWLDGSFAPFAAASMPASQGVFACFQRVAAAHAAQGRATRLLRGAFHRVPAAVAEQLLQATRIQARCARLDGPAAGEPLWGALLYLVADYGAPRAGGVG